MFKHEILDCNNYLNVYGTVINKRRRKKAFFDTYQIKLSFSRVPEKRSLLCEIVAIETEKCFCMHTYEQKISQF